MEKLTFKPKYDKIGDKKKADMTYEGMMEESSDKNIYIAEIEPVSDHMQ